MVSAEATALKTPSTLTSLGSPLEWLRQLSLIGLERSGQVLNIRAKESSDKKLLHQRINFREQEHGLAPH